MTINRDRRHRYDFRLGTVRQTPDRHRSRDHHIVFLSHHAVLTDQRRHPSWEKVAMTRQALGQGYKAVPAPFLFGACRSSHIRGSLQGGCVDGRRRVHRQAGEDCRGHSTDSTIECLISCAGFSRQEWLEQGQGKDLIVAKHDCPDCLATYPYWPNLGVYVLRNSDWSTELFRRLEEDPSCALQRKRQACCFEQDCFMQLLYKRQLTEHITFPFEVRTEYARSKRTDLCISLVGICPWETHPQANESVPQPS